MSAPRLPAALGGDPAFPEGLPFARPAAPPLGAVAARLAPSYDRGMLTNGPLVDELEQRARERLGAGDVVAVSSCTAGLVLVLQALEVEGRAAMPSFTFTATAHAAVWNRLEPAFAECEPDAFQVDVDDLATLAADGCGVLVATHVFGSPCDAEAVVAAAAAAGVPAVFDAAHAFGARRSDRPIGTFGDAEVFSLSPTKPLVAGEGGLVATADANLAAALRRNRDYGNAGDYDPAVAGLNARMSELHAAVALESLARFDETFARRHAVADRYAEALAGVVGVSLQHVDDGDVTTWKDLTIRVDAATFGLDRDALALALAADGIDTRRYFWPPVHRQKAYAATPARSLPVTDAVSASVLSLPMFADLALDGVETVAGVIAAIQGHAEAVAAAQPAASSQAWNASTAHSA